MVNIFVGGIKSVVVSVFVLLENIFSEYLYLWFNIYKVQVLMLNIVNNNNFNKNFLLY